MIKVGFHHSRKQEKKKKRKKEREKKETKKWTNNLGPVSLVPVANLTNWPGENGTFLGPM